MKIVLKRRKHRNGVRPKRKGSIKIRMVEFPEHWFQLSLSLTIMQRYTQATLDFCKTPYEDQIGRRKKDHAYNAWKGFYEKANKGVNFVENYKKIDAIDLALNVINYVDPVYTKRVNFDHSKTCKACEHKGNCPYTNISEAKLHRRCPFVRHAFYDYAVDKNNIQPLTQSDMANQALTHLS